jgi:hypothetical protein
LLTKDEARRIAANIAYLNAKSDAADVTKLSDQELLQTLAQQARELGINIDLNYTFHLPKKDEGDSG